MELDSTDTMSQGIVDILSLAAQSRKELFWDIPPDYRSPESLMVDPIGGRAGVIHNEIAPAVIPRTVAAFNQRRLRGQGWTELECRDISEVLCELMHRRDTDGFPCPVLLWEYGSRVAKAERATLPMHFEAVPQGMVKIDDVIAGRARSFACNSRVLALLRRLPWKDAGTSNQVTLDGMAKRVDSGRDLVSFGFRSEAISTDHAASDDEATGDFEELREHLGFVNLRSTSEVLRASSGVFPAQLQHVHETPDGHGIAIEEPFLTVAVIAPPQPGHSNAEAFATGYTIHVDRESGRITTVTAYFANAENRLRSMPDATRAVLEFKKKLLNG